MTTSNLFFGGLVLAGIGQLAISSFVPTIPYMSVHDVSYAGSLVTADRTVHRSRVADWRVTVVPDDSDGPVCNTAPGPDIHQGWSPYKAGPRAESSFSLDVWVGDPGCSERLIPGKKYSMYMSWSPRGEDDPVAYKVSFVPD